MKRSLKILHTVEHYLPFRCGMQEVVTQISEFLVKSGHSVTVATSSDKNRTSQVINGVQIEPFDISGNDINGYKWGDVNRFQEFILKSDFDIIVNFAAQQWATDLCYPLLDKVKAKTIFVPTGFSGLHWPEYSTYYQNLTKYLPKYDHIVVHSDEYQDANYLRASSVSHYSVIPNGAALSDFEKPITGVKNKLKIPDTHFLILLVGNHTGSKGHSQAIDMFASAKIRNAALVIIGKDTVYGCTNGCKKKASYFKLFPFLEFRKGIKTIALELIQSIFDLSVFSKMNTGKKLIVKELPREELISLFKEADVFLFPSSIECFPIVLIEAMAAGKPAIVSNAGSMKNIITRADNGFIIETSVHRGISTVNIDDGAILLEKLWEDKSLRDKFAANSRNSYLNEYTWEVIAKKYETLYLETADKN